MPFTCLLQAAGEDALTSAGSARRERAISVEYDCVLPSSSQLPLYGFEVVVDDIPFEPLRPELGVELLVALHRDLPAWCSYLRLRVEERSDPLIFWSSSFHPCRSPSSCSSLLLIRVESLVIFVNSKVMIR